MRGSRTTYRNSHTVIRRWHDAGVCLLRICLAFTLTFGTTLWAQAGFVADAFAKQGVTIQEDGGGDAGGGDATGGDTGGDTVGGDTGGGNASDDAGGDDTGGNAGDNTGGGDDTGGGTGGDDTGGGTGGDDTGGGNIDSGGGDDAGGGNTDIGGGDDTGGGNTDTGGGDTGDIGDTGGGDTGGGNAGDDTGGDDIGSGGYTGGEQDILYIDDVGVFEEGTTRDCFAYASEGAVTLDGPRAVIDKKGGYIDFDGAIWWTNGDVEYDSNKVLWRMADGDEAIARISPSGKLEAKGTDDGIVTVVAYVPGDYTADGGELAAQFYVELQGQTDSKYVKNIVICDDAGNELKSAYRFEAGTLATAMLELQARVTVYDPAKEKDVVYQVTPSSGLSAQTDGEVADLVWESADTRLGTVSEEGIYRPAVAATNVVYCASTAGFNGGRVTAQATIDMPPENGKEAANGYHPQSELTVKVYYEKYPDQLVGETKFSIADLEELGCVTATYTALKGKEGYVTTTGRGPLLSKVLKAAGVNTDGVARLRFGTPDNYQGVVSWDMLVDKERYYFPNIDIASYQDAVQVAPMIAIDAYRNVGSDVGVHTDGMLDTRRFLLLFGAKKPAQGKAPETTTNLQVYNIHTLYVELAGSPPAKNGTQVTVEFVDSITGEVLKTEKTASPDSVSAPKAPEHDGYTFKGWVKTVDKSGNVTFTTQYESNDSEGEKDKSSGSEKPSEESPSPATAAGGTAPTVSTPSGTGHSVNTVPTNNGDGDEGGTGTHDLISAKDQSSSGGGQSAPAGSAGGQAQVQQLETEAAPETAVTQLDPSEIKTVSQGRWSALQAINKHPSNVEDLMLNNPFAPYAAPFFAGVFAAGGLEAGIAFFRQKRMPKALKALIGRS